MEDTPRIQNVASQSRSSRVTVKIKSTPENFTGRIIFMSMVNDNSWGSEDNMKECESNAQLVSLCDAEQDNGHSSVFVQRKKWYSISEDCPQGEWDKMSRTKCLNLRWSRSEKVDIQSFELRAQCPEVSSKSTSCVRGEGVQGVLTHFCGGVAQTCHDDRVVEL